MFWARTQWAFNRLFAAQDPALAARMHANPNLGDVPKLWAEAAFEQRRLEVAPDKPSRLDSLFAWFDPLEAFLFIDSTAVGAVWRGTVAEATRWAAVDFTLFEVIRPSSPNATAYASAWEKLLARADRYWQPDSVGGLRQAEALVAGPITLVEKVTLRGLLEQHRLIEPQPAPTDLAPPGSGPAEVEQG